MRCHVPAMFLALVITPILPAVVLGQPDEFIEIDDFDDGSRFARHG